MLTGVLAGLFFATLPGDVPWMEINTMQVSSRVFAIVIGVFMTKAFELNKAVVTKAKVNFTD